MVDLALHKELVDGLEGFKDVDEAMGEANLELQMRDKYVHSFLRQAY